MLTADDPLVLCYHAVSETWPAELAVTPRAFREQLETLLEGGYRTTTLSDALAAPGRKIAVLTFDDGYRSLLERVQPVLEELGAVATVFAVTGFAGTRLRWPGIDEWADGEHARELDGLSWEELRRLRRAGWEVGSHTRTHPRLTTLGDDELRDELQSSKRACEEELGEECGALAYPYGDVDERVVAAARGAGYRYAVTLPARLHRATALHWPRVGVYRPDTLRRFRIKTSPATRSIRLLVGR